MKKEKEAVKIPSNLQLRHLARNRKENASLPRSLPRSLTLFFFKKACLGCVACWIFSPFRESYNLHIVLPFPRRATIPVDQTVRKYGLPCLCSRYIGSIFYRIHPITPFPTYTSHWQLKLQAAGPRWKEVGKWVFHHGLKPRDSTPPPLSSKKRTSAPQQVLLYVPYR